MNTFQLKIIASNKVFFDGQAQSLIIPRLDGGSEAYLAMHENLSLIHISEPTRPY